MTPNEERILLETRLRNLKRKYVRLIQHADLLIEAQEIKQEINNIETILQ